MKFSLTLWISLLCSIAGQAQVKFAVAAGYNHNTARIHKRSLLSTSLQETGYVPGAYANFRVETEFEAPLYFTGMIGYDMRGYTYQALPDSSVKTRIHYVSLSPMLNYHFNTGANSYFSVFAGPVVEFAISGKETIDYNGETKTQPMRFSMSGYYSIANVAVQSGVAYHFNKWFIEGSYHLGVTSINNEEEVDKTNIKTRGMAVGIGYWLR
jgi:hypothetical protein